MSPDGEVTNTTSTESTVSDFWDGWVENIVQERKSDSGSIRLLGFVRQIATEFVIYTIIGMIFATFCLLVHKITPFILMPNAWYAYPMYVGATISLLFLAGHDKWIRPKEERQQSSEDSED